MNSHSMPLVPPEKLPPRGSSELRTVFPYVPGIDGLRALAILAVLIYHAETGILPGGYLGVEVFFVISGYLITCLLMAEYQNNLRLHTFRFWYRRARRLLPALFVLLVSVLAFSTVVLPDEVASLRAVAFAALAGAVRDRDEGDGARARGSAPGRARAETRRALAHPRQRA